MNNGHCIDIRVPEKRHPSHARGTGSLRFSHGGLHMVYPHHQGRVAQLANPFASDSIQEYIGHLFA
jgi:hypothetical protein